MSGSRTILAFGTFDGIHKGHLYFLHQARLLGSRLIVALARDETVRTLKHREPRQPESDRLACIQALPDVAEAILGDLILDSFQTVVRVHPDVIAIGHDQTLLREHLEQWLKHQKKKPEMIVISKCEGETGI
ncbi:MAG: FAD synthase [Candidatus Uhrbacteria bacterium GW2011_GWF2_41_16]|uniref:FAD synthase n=2 Tax=Candidatus Uhriibacteriota TaxID=1752732 RepID=A0A0G0YA32_9BACT|nr:MAG: FAD synthase [Candidatus Uhrbacteria bacterium GW2011_GWA2_41_10]KKR86053.1 MAG: FAD synthase [Candidatus Uhrbacteria bacterium GW2011_GWC2_41_11]KKR97107.1 MAG: FAD synthase [Candidatus Uhrbacteria bacterium GW2011_GWF2_41_16]HBP00310.1 FAD synthase [Candidatus Uhrbacteria bacterium]